ncbi:MAG TPA: hypothetical protein VN696_13045 [Pyrinomonadaceae bacterium]|nr:hypothetical protein [Pyrinomonadaceae bacterium]
MQHVTKQDCIRRIVSERDARAVITSIINRRWRRLHHIDADYILTEYCRQMMRNEAVAAANIQHFMTTWNDPRNLQRHVVSPSDFAPSAFAQPTTLHAAHDRLERVCRR